MNSAGALTLPGSDNLACYDSMHYVCTWFGPSFFLLRFSTDHDGRLPVSEVLLELPPATIFA